MQQLSIQQNDEFDTIAALKELYIYVTTYKEQVCSKYKPNNNEKKKLNFKYIIYIYMKTNRYTFIPIRSLLFPSLQIIEALEMDINCKKLHLANKLENVGVTLDGMDDC